VSNRNAETLVDRVRGETAPWPRAVAVSASLGLSVAVMAYRFLRQPEKE